MEKKISYNRNLYVITKFQLYIVIYKSGLEKNHDLKKIKKSDFLNLNQIF